MNPAQTSVWDDRWIARNPVENGGTGTLCAASPPENFAAWIAAARTRGIRRLVTGFLPDEVDSAGESWREDLEYFLAHFEFRPFRLEPSQGHAATEADPVVHIVDQRWAEGGDPVSRGLALTWAQLTRRPLREIVLADLTEKELAAAVAESSGVVHDVQDWMMGFAVDDLARRCGRGVVRLHNPGYSPFRHALLNQTVPPLILPPGGVCRLRPLFQGSRWPLAPVSASAGDLAWVSGDDATERWRGLLGDDFLVEFWASTLPRLARIIRPRRAEGWLHRPAAWAILARLVEGGAAAGISAEARARAVEVVTDWLHAEHRASIKGLLRDRAAARWVRVHPEWIAVWQRGAGTSREASTRLAGWVEQAGEWKDCPTPLGRFFAAAWSMLDGASPTLGLARAWRDDWGRVRAAGGADAMRKPAIREICLRAMLERVREIPHRGVPAGAAALLDDPEPWQVLLGPVAESGRVFAALHGHMPARARGILRVHAHALGVKSTRGFWRIARAVLRDDATTAAWLEKNVDRTAAQFDLELLDVFRVWLSRRRWLLWRRRRGVGVDAEVQAADDLLGAVVRRGLPENPWIRGHRVRLAALAGRGEETLALLASSKAGPGTARELSGPAALAFWLRDQAALARRVLVDFPADETSAKAVLEHAVAWHMLGVNDRASSLVSRLYEIAPGYFQADGIRDGRFAWLALAAKAAGRRELTAAVRARAGAIDESSGALVDDESWGNRPWAGVWDRVVQESSFDGGASTLTSNNRESASS